MTSPRQYDVHLPASLRRIKRAFARLVKGVGTQDDAAEILADAGYGHTAGGGEMDQRRVSEHTHQNTNWWFTIPQTLALEEAARGSPDWPQVTRALAAHHGFALLPLAAALAGDSSLHRSLGEVSKETGEVVNKGLTALADGDMTPDRIRELNIPDEIREAIDALSHLLGLVEQVLEGGGSPVTHLKAC